LMTPPMSVQLRKLAIKWRFEDEEDVAEIVDRTGYSKSTLYSLFAMYERYGTPVNPMACYTGRPRTLTADDVQYLVDDAIAHPRSHLDELR
ncbi:hypothetical protein EXIGLDRAFT_595018, partial [Exidia glandulosa HHB12029]